MPLRLPSWFAWLRPPPAPPSPAPVIHARREPAPLVPRTHLDTDEVHDGPIPEHLACPGCGAVVPLARLVATMVLVDERLVSVRRAEWRCRMPDCGAIGVAWFAR